MVANLNDINICINIYFSRLELDFPNSARCVQNGAFYQVQAELTQFVYVSFIRMQNY